MIREEGSYMRGVGGWNCVCAISKPLWAWNNCAAKTLWLNGKPERVFDSGWKRGLSAEADLSTMLKDPARSWVVDNR
jgi:hypothetical protein